MKYDRSKGESNTDMSDGEAVLKIGNYSFFLLDCHDFLFSTVTSVRVPRRQVCEVMV